MKSTEHLALAIEKLDECHTNIREAAQRMSQGPEWDQLQHALVAADAARVCAASCGVAIEAEAIQAQRDTENAVATAVAAAVKASEAAPAV